ncbi:MAG: NAD(P)-dependent oxidoreductase [Caulobacteraceae bacterium]
MQIGLIGASGNIGARITSEGVSRGHRFTAFSRAPREADTEHVAWRKVDVLDSASLRAELAGLDVLVNAFGPGSAARDANDATAQSIRAPELFARVATSILTALEARARLRVIVVGGARSLEIAPGRQIVDEPGAAERLPAIGVPKEYIAAVRGHREALNIYRQSNRLWTYFSPAMFIGPGERTGRFRLGGDQAVIDADGRGRISYEDYAVALLDEIEIPRHIQRRFTIGY